MMTAVMSVSVTVLERQYKKYFEINLTEKLAEETKSARSHRSGNGSRVLRNSPGVTRCWSRAWSHDSLSHGIDKMTDPVMLSIFGVQLLMFVQVVVTLMHVRQRIYVTWRVAHIRSRRVFRDSMRRLRKAAERGHRARLRRQTITATQLLAYR